MYGSVQQEFERDVSLCLADCGVDLSVTSCVGLAVSGGADSVSMLLAVRAIVPRSVRLEVITVNHNLRPKEQTDGDAAFVQSLCGHLGVACTTVVLPRGAVLQAEKQRNKGIEEAARHLRYDAFRQFAEQKRAQVVCTAHTLSDHVETVCMHFLQGSGAEGLCGIPLRRGLFVRPLRRVTRAQVESYLAAAGQGFCTDLTNGDPAFFRNRVRLAVVPFLERENPGFCKCAQSLSQKMAWDEDFISQQVDAAMQQAAVTEQDGAVTANTAAFCALHPALGRRLLFRMVGLAGADVRVPAAFFGRVADACHKSLATGADVRVPCCGMEAVAHGGTLTVRRSRGVVTESGFYAILQKDAVVVGDWQFYAETMKGGTMLCEHNSGARLFVPGVEPPLAIRSMVTGDRVRCSDGSERSVAGVFDGWKAKGARSRIPLVQELLTARQDVVALWGGLLGFCDWVVSGRHT